MKSFTPSKNKFYITSIISLITLFMISSCSGHNEISHKNNKKNNSSPQSKKLSGNERQRAILNPYYLTDEFFHENMGGADNSNTSNITHSETNNSSLKKNSQYKHAQIGIVNLSNENAIPDTIKSGISKHLHSREYKVIQNHIIKNAVKLSDCLTPITQRCLSEELGKYPGIRYIVNISNSIEPAQYPGNFNIDYQIIDTALIYAYPKVSYTHPSIISNIYIKK